MRWPSVRLGHIKARDGEGVSLGFPEGATVAMNTHNTIQHTPGSRKLLVHTVLSLLITAIGIALLVYMITVEDEPGAVPLALIALGIAWLVIARLRMRPRHH